MFTAKSFRRALTVETDQDKTFWLAATTARRHPANNIFAVCMDALTTQERDNTPGTQANTNDECLCRPKLQTDRLGVATNQEQ